MVSEIPNLEIGGRSQENWVAKELQKKRTYLHLTGRSSDRSLEGRATKKKFEDSGSFYEKKKGGPK